MIITYRVFPFNMVALYFYLPKVYYNKQSNVESFNRS